MSQVYATQPSYTFSTAWDNTATDYIAWDYSDSTAGNRFEIPVNPAGTGTAPASTPYPWSMETPPYWEELMRELEDLGQAAEEILEEEEEDEPGHEFPHYGYRQDRWEDRGLD